MDNKHLSLPITFSVNNEVSNTDTRFLNVVIDVLHLGDNFNNCIFEKDIVEANLDTIKNTPILGFIEEVNGEDDFKGHEWVISKKDGKVYRKYLGRAYGVIPESCNPRWITKMCSDGIEREFLQVDGLMWTKFDDASDIMFTDIEKPHSMELDPNSVEGYEDENGKFHFTSFSFNGCCILGDNKEPAMIDSIVEVQFTMSDFVRDIQKELSNKVTVFTDLVNEKNKGGNETMPNKNNDFALSVMQQFENIATIVRQQETVADRWGEAISRYSLVDIQDNEVIVMDRSNGYNYYGFTFTMNGDAPNIDFSCGKRKKISYENYEEGATIPEGVSVFETIVKEVEDVAFSKVEEANQKTSDAEAKVSDAESNYTKVSEDFEALKTEYEEIKPKYDAYVAEDEQRKADELDAKKDAEFARFEKALGCNADFEALKERKAELTLDEITTECSVLFTRVNLENANTDFSKSNGSVVAGLIDDTDDGDSMYVSTKYGNIPVRR